MLLGLEAPPDLDLSSWGCVVLQISTNLAGMCWWSWAWDHIGGERHQGPAGESGGQKPGDAGWVQTQELHHDTW